MTQPASRLAQAPSVIPLHGRWSRAVGGRVIDSVAVPGTYPPVGACTLAREVDLGAVDPGSRYFLRTEGVLAWARFAIDGAELGTAGPWSRHRFEIPRERVRARMRVSAEITDILAPFGPTPGRRFDAGLFRPIAIERRPATYIADWHLAYRLAAPWAAAECTVTVELDGPDRPELACALIERHSGRVVAQARARAGAPLAFTLEHPRLWSPAMPVLYDLRVSAGEDQAEEAVGFRRLESRGRDLWLNGERLLLKGVCRHEFMSGFGYSPPEAEVRRELARIRHAGFNHIRLVHSPQAPWVPRIAAEVGILVSEEPGTCFHDLGDPRVADPAIDALTAMVRRDRNLPSILAWYIYNECNPNSAYAVRAAAACRALDPTCLLAMADCSGRVDDIKAMVTAADLSFYGINCYTYWGPDYQKWMIDIRHRSTMLIPP
jgi:beta-glucuronidase